MGASGCQMRRAVAVAGRTSARIFAPLLTRTVHWIMASSTCSPRTIRAHSASFLGDMWMLLSLARPTRSFSAGMPLPPRRASAGFGAGCGTCAYDCRHAPAQAVSICMLHGFTDMRMSHDSVGHMRSAAGLPLLQRAGLAGACDNTSPAWCAPFPMQPCSDAGLIGCSACSSGDREQRLAPLQHYKSPKVTFAGTMPLAGLATRHGPLPLPYPDMQAGLLKALDKRPSALQKV